MTREQAMEIVKKLYNNSLFLRKDKEALEALIPELRESEDGRIRREIIQFLKDAANSKTRVVNANTFAEWATYLENLKEQKHPNGCFTCDEYKKGYEAGRSNGFTAGYNKAMKEQKPVDEPFEEWIDGWYNEHHRDGYITMDEREFKNFCRGIKNIYQQKPAEWSEDIRDEFTRNIRNLITDKLTVHTKGLDGSEISSTVFIDDKTAKDIASGVLFYVGKEATKNPNREISEWSQEDKDKLEQCIRIVSGWEGDYDIVKSPYSNFLKSLRLDSYKNCNSRWKPSEEQMGAIRTAIDVLRGQVYDGKELYPGTSHVLTMMLNYFKANNNDTKV